MGSLPEPEVPIELRGRCGFRKRPADVTTIDADRHFLNVAQQSLLHHVNRTQEPVPITALLRAHDEDLVAVLLARLANELVFLQRERQGFLAKHMLAGLQRLDGNLHVPMVGSHHTHDVNVLPLQNFAVVAVHVGLALADVGMVLGLLGMFGIDITDGHNVAEPRVFARVTLPHAAHTNAPDDRSIIGRVIGDRGPTPTKIGHGSDDSRSRHRLPQEITTRGRVLVHWGLLLMAGTLGIDDR